MLTLQKTADTRIASVETSQNDLDYLLDREWLLSNERGGYASSTIIGCNTRRYHGLLVGSLNPPVNRIIALSSLLEMVISHGKVFNLSTFEFNEKIVPKGFMHIKRFRRDTGVHFDYQLEHLELTKSIYLLTESDTVAIEYDFSRVEKPLEFVLRPFVGLRDYHSLQKSYAPLKSYNQSGKLLIRHNAPGSCELLMGCPVMKFEKDRQWWFNFVYRKDRERGQDFCEDLWSPGFYKCSISSSTKLVFWASLSDYRRTDLTLDESNSAAEKVQKSLRQRQKKIISTAKAKDKILKKLILAADQFVVRRGVGQNHETTVLAGFPWFADWGRDAFVALPGLLLETGRFDEARSVLTTFADHCKDGLIPSRFDDRKDTAHFNSVDASLWFINAAFQYLQAASDSKTFAHQLLPTIRDIINSYQNGTQFDIHADDDGLITAGDQQTQLTWMDAKYDQTAFTPRHGKAVEINALWYNALCYMARYYSDSDSELANYYHSMADRLEKAFSKLFWNQEKGYLNDCILPDGTADSSLRPNQIFAVSLNFSPLSASQQKSVVEAVEKHLLTPFGLRTLAACDSRYKGVYAGPQQQRDEAYHQGTVWPFLIGPFVESYLKVNDFDRKARKKAAEFIEPLLHHMTEDGCLGQISEIFDGDPPHQPKGCFAQAWSVAELIRAYKLINS